jgi:alkaline phosphatase
MPGIHQKCAVIATVAFALLAGCNSHTPTPANVILIIGDGMDQSQITIARNYLAGNEGKLLLDSLPALATVNVQTLEANNPQRYVYVADSANTATTLATGKLTSRGRISRDTSGLVSLPTIVEQAQAAGYRTGLVTTASITDATPAAFASHSSNRSCGGPGSLVKPYTKNFHAIDCTQEAIDQDGPGSIAHQLANSNTEVMLGGGSAYFSQSGFGGEDSPRATAQRQGYQWITNTSELAAASNKEPLLGLFATGHLPVQLMGENQRKAEPVVIDAKKANLAAEIFSCVENPAAKEVPSLRAMTDKALDILGDDPKRGFFLMVESASIDKQSHARSPCGHIGEVKQLEEALLSALRFAERHPNTLILVTADHAHAAQIIPDQKRFSFGKHNVHSPGSVARVRTPEGSVMMINYATSNQSSATHTGNNVPLYAHGPGTQDMPIYMTQSDIYHWMTGFLDIN